MKIRIEQDTDPMHPRTEYDNFGHMVCFHRRYNLGDIHDYKSGDYSGWDEMAAAITEAENTAVILPLYLMDHSGISISCGNSHFRACDPQGFDWGCVGFIFARREDVLKEYSKKRISKQLLKKVEKVLLSEVECYNQYLTGDVWYYCIEDDNGECIDLCGGFFGHDYCEQEAADMVKYLKQQEKEVALKTKAAQSSMPCCQP